MFDISHLRAFKTKSCRSLLNEVSLLFGALFSVLLFSSCAHISIEPKDPQLLSMEQIARDVTVHLMSVDPKNYEQFQHLLSQEITPGVLKQLQDRGVCAKSAAEVKARLQSLNKSGQASLVKIASAEFPGKATETGLVPIEIKGSVVTITSDGKEKLPTKFDLLYLVGTNKNTHKLIIASIQIRQ